MQKKKKKGTRKEVTQNILVTRGLELAGKYASFNINKLREKMERIPLQLNT
jgi:hypothetical protein